jgi:hypothetical protein
MNYRYILQFEKVFSEGSKFQGESGKKIEIVIFQKISLKLYFDKQLMGY